MSPLQIQRQITKLQREREELMDRILVLDLAALDPQAMAMYNKFDSLSGEIKNLRELRNDIWEAKRLARNGAAAVAAAMELWGIE